MRGTIPPIVGNRLREARLAQELTQQQLAVKVGISRGSIANIEAAKQNLTTATMIAICWALGMTPEELWAGLEGKLA